MRHITIPADVQLIDLVTRKFLKKSETSDDLAPPMKFSKFIFETVLADDRFGASVKNIVMASKLYKKFEGCKPGDVVQIEETHWEKVKEVVETPKSPYLPAVVTQLLTMLNAILDAPDDDALEKAKEEAAAKVKEMEAEVAAKVKALEAPKVDA